MDRYLMPDIKQLLIVVGDNPDDGSLVNKLKFNGVLFNVI
jgi:hypothetical protein